MELISTATLWLLLQVSALTALVWQGAKALLDQAGLVPAKWLIVLAPRAVCVALFLVFGLNTLPAKDLGLGCLLALVGANLVYDATRKLTEKKEA